VADRLELGTPPRDGRGLSGGAVRFCRPAWPSRRRLTGVVPQPNVLNESFRTSRALNDSFKTTAGEAAGLRPPKYPPGTDLPGRPVGPLVPPSAWLRFERRE
jgi:hypothetical protein